MCGGLGLEDGPESRWGEAAPGDVLWLWWALGNALDAESPGENRVGVGVGMGDCPGLHSKQTPVSTEPHQEART